ncbi:hypothetical protein ACFXPX_32805 [Kitasatospora sp. NPDC059146]|uniref:hypothetical protein n=1 Tax=unclassified Kitasatospora TaxID=2633591 RepID=UPI00367D8424
MHTSVLSAAQITVAPALAAWMANGFTNRPGRLLRWRMFCRATFTIIILPHQHPGPAPPSARTAAPRPPPAGPRTGEAP